MRPRGSPNPSQAQNDENPRRREGEGQAAAKNEKEHAQATKCKAYNEEACGSERTDENREASEERARPTDRREAEGQNEEGDEHR